MTLREAQWAGVEVKLKRRRDSHRQLTMYGGLAENEEKRAWTRDATCAGWNATALPVDVLVKFLDSR